MKNIQDTIVDKTDEEFNEKVRAIIKAENNAPEDIFDSNKLVEEQESRLGIDLSFLKIKKLKKYKFEDFIEEFDDIKFYKHCEAIIHRNGLLSWASPSHQKALISESGKTEEEIWNMIPVWEDVLAWMVEYTGIIAVWPDWYVSPKKKGMTLAQESTIRKLIEHDLLRMKGREY